MDKTIQEITTALDRPAYVTIVSHRNPDGDAIGSSLALSLMLQTFGHTVRTVFPSEYPRVFEWMAGVKDVVIHDIDPERGSECVERADWIMALDFNSFDRIDKLGKLIVEQDKRVIMIDHHIDPEPIGEIMFSDTEASSTAELIYRLFEEAGWKKRMTMDMADCIYTGLITDTGSFRHATNPTVYRIAGELKAMGIDDFNIQDQVFDNLTEKQVRLLGHCLANRMEVLPELKTGIIALTKKDYLDFNIQRGDTEGIVNYLLKIPGISVAAFITEQPKLVKLSLRSKGDISVQRMASEHFNGGGHFNASGGYMFKPLDFVLKRFKDILPQYINNTDEK